MRYLRLQRSQANRRRSERDAERGGTRTPPAQPETDARPYPSPAEPAQEPRKRKSG